MSEFRGTYTPRISYVQDGRCVEEQISFAQSIHRRSSIRSPHYANTKKTSWITSVVPTVLTIVRFRRIGMDDSCIVTVNDLMRSTAQTRKSQNISLIYKRLVYII